MPTVLGRVRPVVVAVGTVTTVVMAVAVVVVAAVVAAAVVVAAAAAVAAAAVAAETGDAHAAENVPEGSRRFREPTVWKAILCRNIILMRLTSVGRYFKILFEVIFVIVVCVSGVRKTMF